MNNELVIGQPVLITFRGGIVRASWDTRDKPVMEPTWFPCLVNVEKVARIEELLSINPKAHCGVTLEELRTHHLTVKSVDGDLVKIRDIDICTVEHCSNPFTGKGS